jgi:hypothetical protein
VSDDERSENVMKRVPSPALVVALVALFFSLAGGAIGAAVVPLAKHALTADVANNAKKLGGKTPAQIRASLRGAAGPQGIAGPAGPQGAKGDTGATGGPGPQAPQGVQGPKGDKGDKGDVGAGLKIVGTVAAQGDLPTTGNTTGDAYLIGGNLWVWTGSTWTNAGPVQGPKGDQGNTGPQGIQGVQGPPGTPGTADVTVHTAPFALTAGDSEFFTVSCGPGQKAVSGGFSSDGNVYSLDTFSTTQDDGWTLYLYDSDPADASGTVEAVCLG